MDRQYGDARYTSCMIEDRKEGYIGLELRRLRHGISDRIARILFWDASGQFSVETLGSDVPLDVLEELLLEVKTSIKTS